MQFSYIFTFVSTSLALLNVALSSPIVNTSIVITEAEFDYWLATTDAELTFIGDTAKSHNPLAAHDTRATYCSKRTVNVCGESCTVYQGGVACLNAPNTNCLAATNNVGFCDRSGCGDSCQLSTCAFRLDDVFCYTPGTRSINVPP
ncbi:hypothetical protein CPB85DRAFT_903258 [Mucidula mucida]|nr:hypothetical protein CPB85DRAFT_903258 [Mucidula mucida]